MKTAVIGAGAIGGLVAGYLKSAGEDVSLIARPAAVEAIRTNGLEISGVRGNIEVQIEASEKLSFKPDLAILATKTQDVEPAVRENLPFLKDSLVLTSQNGVRSDGMIARYLPKERVISSIVMFGATSLNPGSIVHNFEGSWIIGKPFARDDQDSELLKGFLGKIFPTHLSDNIMGMKYLKVFVNANNCIPAILGISMQEAFLDLKISSICIAIWSEGLKIIQQAGIKLVSLPDFPLERLLKLAAMPKEEAAKVFSVVMSSLSKEPLYGSILQSIKRGKPSEIDYINGEFAALAGSCNARAPLNERLTAMVHTVEKTGRFFSKEELINNTKGLFA